jgi:putative permease
VNQTPVALRQQRSQFIFFGLLLLSGLYLLISFPRLSLPLASAYVLALILKPVEDFFWSLPRRHRFAASVLLATLVGFMIWPLFTITTTVGAEAQDLSLNFPRFEMLLRQKFIELRAMVYRTIRFQIDIDPVVWMGTKLKTDGGALIANLPKLMGNLLEWLILTPVFTWFFLREGKKLKQGFLRLIPNPWFERSYMLLYQFNGRFGGYIMAKTVEATILGVILLLGLLLIDYPYAFLLGFIGGLTNIVPYVGPLLGWGAALVVGLMEPHGDGALMTMTIIYVIANFIDMALVFPLLVSKIVNLHPLIVVGSVIIGSEMGGLVGMIISVPVATFFKLALVDVHKSLYVENQK